MTIPEIPLISVCIPVFNGENFIKESINSVINQTEKNFELLVIDNCSTDQTVNIVTEYNDPRIRVFVNKQNLGIIPNFNKCIELAKGDFIVLLPHDDVLLPTALETFSKTLAFDPDAGLAYSSYYIIDERGKIIQFLSKCNKDKVMTGDEAFTILAEGCPIQCAMVRREVYTHLGLWNLDIMIADWDMWCRIALAGYKFAYFKDPQNCYRVHSQNGYISHIKNNKYSIGIFEGLKKIYNTISVQSDLQKLRPKSAKLILEPVAKDLVYSVLLCRGPEVKRDVNLFVEVLKWAGIFRMFPFFLSLPLYLMNRFREHLKMKYLK